MAAASRLWILLAALFVSVALPRLAEAVEHVDVEADAILDVDARATVRIGQRKATGHMITAFGTLPALLGAIISADAETPDGSPLVATGMALGATGSALLLPWEPAVTPTGRPRATMRVIVGYKPGGVRIGLAGRF